jgi:hypothetical protein
MNEDLNFIVRFAFFSITVIPLSVVMIKQGKDLKDGEKTDLPITDRIALWLIRNHSEEEKYRLEHYLSSPGRLKRDGRSMFLFGTITLTIISLLWIWIFLALIFGL